MKTTLAILGIFAAAVLATTFAVSAYAISQTNEDQSTDQEHKQTSQSRLEIKLVFNNAKEQQLPRPIRKANL